MRRLAFLLMLLPTVALAQTQHDRIAARGQSTFDSLRNTAVIVVTGATPAVGLGNVFKTGNGSATAITDFLGGGDSQQIFIVCGDGNTTIVNGATIATGTGANLSCAPNTVYSFIRDAAQSKWVQSGTGSGGGGGGGGGGTSSGAPVDSLQRNCASSFCGDADLLWNGTTKVLTMDVHGTAGGSSFITGATGLNQLQTSATGVTLNALDTSSKLALNGPLTLSPDLSHHNVFPTGLGAPGTVLQTDGASPSSTLSWSNAFPQGLSVPFGTITTDLNPLELDFTLNNSATVFNGVKWMATNTAYAAGTKDYQFCVNGGAQCVTIDPLGAFSAPNQVGSGDSSAAGNLEMLQGPLPAILPNNVGFAAPTSVASGGFLMLLPGTPCAGGLVVSNLTGSYGTVTCTGSNAARAAAQTASLSPFTLCSAANCPSGEYRVEVHANSTQVCSAPGPASLSFAITYTDGAGTKTSQPIPLIVGGSVTMLTGEPLGDTAATAYGYALIGSTGVNPIQLATTLVGCTTGTAQYSYSAEATRIQ